VDIGTRARMYQVLVGLICLCHRLSLVTCFVGSKVAVVNTKEQVNVVFRFKFVLCSSSNTKCHFFPHFLSLFASLSVWISQIPSCWSKWPTRYYDVK
jgi:hypothetical protein